MLPTDRLVKYSVRPCVVGTGIFVLRMGKLRPWEAPPHSRSLTTTGSRGQDGVGACVAPTGSWERGDAWAPNRHGFALWPFKVQSVEPWPRGGRRGGAGEPGAGVPTGSGAQEKGPVWGRGRQPCRERVRRGRGWLGSHAGSDGEERHRREGDLPLGTSAGSSLRPATGPPRNGAQLCLTIDTLPAEGRSVLRGDRGGAARAGGSA